jgi:hypothetical protein
MNGLPSKAHELLKNTLMAMFDWLVPVSLRLVQRGCKMTLKQDDIHMVQSLCNLCEAQLQPLIAEDGDPNSVRFPLSPHCTSQSGTDCCCLCC